MITKKSHRIISIIRVLISGISLFTVFPISTVAQYSLDEKVSFVYVNGTSTLHDWTAIVMKMKGSLEAEISSDHIVKIKYAKITIPATSLKSEKKAMDKNMYKALKSDNYPEIIYEHQCYTIHDNNIIEKGQLTIAGITKTIDIKVVQERTAKHIKINGVLNLKMSDFNIKPPEFLLGSFKTGDDIVVTFYFMFCEND